MMGRSYTIDYTASHQVKMGLAKVEIDGSGVSLNVKAVSRQEQLVAALDERRRRSRVPEPQGSPPAAASGDDPVALLETLGKLRDAGALTDEEFEAKKAELFDRM
jgi:hypothetical protein